MDSEKIIARLDHETRHRAQDQLPKPESVKVGTRVPTNVESPEFGWVCVIWETYTWRHHKFRGYGWRMYHAELLKLAGVAWNALVATKTETMRG